MRALVYTGPRQLQLQDLSEPPIGPTDVRVRVHAAGVCGSDLHGFLGRSKKRVPPLVLGHEFAGEIVDGGGGVSGFARGDSVAVYPIVGCGECRFCTVDRENLCSAKQIYGLDFHGGLAEFVTAPLRCLFRMPSGMSFIAGSLVEPLANAVHALRRCGDVRNQKGLIYGAGPIGVFCALMAKYRGAQALAVIDRNPLRLARIKELAADLTIDASSEDPVRAVLEWTGGQGADFTIDAVGNTICRQNSIAATVTGGAVLCIGLEEEVCAVDTRAVVTREVDLRGCYAYTRADFAEALSLLERKLLPCEALVTKTALAQGQRTFDELASGQSAIMKAVFEI